MPTELDIALKEAADYLNGELEKQAQNPLENFLAAVPDQAKASIRNALIGGLLGAGGGAYAAGPGERARGGLLGAGLGAATGGLGTLGMQMLGGQLQLPSEAGVDQSLVGRVAGGLTGAAASNLGLTTGGLLGALGAYKYGPRSQAILEELRKLAPKDQQVRELLKGLETTLKEPATNYMGEAFRIARQPLKYSGPTDINKMMRKLIRSPHLKNTEKVKGVYRLLTQALAKGTGTAGVKAKQLGAAGGELASAMRINRILKALPQTMKRSRLPWMMLPAGIGAGYLVDKYLKGEY